MGPTVAELVAGIIDQIEARPVGPGHPPMPSIEVIDTLGLLLNVAVHRADIQDRDGTALVLDKGTPPPSAAL